MLERGQADVAGVLSGGSIDPSGTRPSTRSTVALVSGHAEVRGQHVPVAWTVTDLAHDPVTGEVWVRATTSVRRRDFGMRRLMWLAGDEVGIEVVVAARQRETR